MNPKTPVDLTIRFPNDPSYLALVADASENLAMKMKFDKKKIRKIRNAVMEACTNAIEHGNKNDPTKEVLLVFRVEETKLEINVSDQGGGFDVTHMGDPSIEDKINDPALSKRGWGVFMIKKYVDEVRVDESGNLGLTMVIYLKE